MLNHARTLLMNIDCPQIQTMAGLGDELLAPGFKAVELPSYIETIRTCLFGVTPTRFMRNYRTRQLLACIHADSELEKFVTALDSRITYSMSDNLLVEPALYVPKVMRIGGNDSNTLYTYGSPVAPDGSGQTTHRFLIDIPTPSTLTVTKVHQQLKPKLLFDLELTDGLSELFPLTGSGYSFRINANNVDVSWEVAVINRPQYDLSQLVMSLEKIGESAFLALFGVPRVEPYTTFGNLWFESREIPARIAGLVLALIYRTDAIRQNKN